jgi:hypothetical protein
LDWKGRPVAPLLFVSLLLTSCVRVASYAHIEPPVRYNHAYDGPVVERVVPLSEVRKLCMSMGTSPHGVACAWTEDGTCYRILPSDYGNEALAVYRRHETAHCNGWAANHPRDE